MDEVLKRDLRPQDFVRGSKELCCENENGLKMSVSLWLPTGLLEMVNRAEVAKRIPVLT